MAGRSSWGGGDINVLFDYTRQDPVNIVDDYAARPHVVEPSQIARVKEANRWALSQISDRSRIKPGWLSYIWVVEEGNVGPNESSAPCLFTVVICVSQPSRGYAVTIGQYIWRNFNSFGPEIKTHEYIHVVGWEGRGMDFQKSYFSWAFPFGGGDATYDNPWEAQAYLWQWWIQFYPTESPPWNTWRRPVYTTSH